MARLFAHHKVVALTVVATLFLSGIVATGSQPLHFAPINVSREQYDAALAKWNNLNVEEYEEIVRTWTGCRYKLVVSIDRSTGTPVETTVDSEDLQVPSIGGCLHDGANPTDTVGTLFSLVDYVLATRPKPLRTLFTASHNGIPPSSTRTWVILATTLLMVVSLWRQR